MDITPSGPPIPEAIVLHRAHLTPLQTIAEEHGTSIHDMPPEAADIFSLYGIYTTTTPRDPGDFGSFRRGMATVRSLGRLADNTREAMQHVEGFEDAGDQLGSRLAEAFGGITAIHGEDVHVVNPHPGTGDGKVAAERMLFTLPNETQAWLLHHALQALLRTSRLEDSNTVSLRMQANGLYTVEARSINEYMIRVIGSAVTQLVAEEDSRRGFKLPPDKPSLLRWKQRGETFPTDIEERLVAIADAYRRLKLTGTYPGYDNLEPGRVEAPLGTEPAAALEGARMILNGLIWPLRGGSQFNQEQDPVIEARLLIEEDVDLRRDPTSLEDVMHGPPTPRTPRISERVREKGIQTVAGARQRPFLAAFTVVTKTIGAVETLLEAGLEHTTHIIREGRLLVDDRREWRRQQAAAKMAEAYIAAIILDPER